MDTDYEDDFDFSPTTSDSSPFPGTSSPPSAAQTIAPSLAPGTNHSNPLRLNSDSEPSSSTSTDEYSGLFDRASAVRSAAAGGHSDWSTEEPTSYDFDDKQGISIMPPLHTRQPAAMNELNLDQEQNEDEDEEKQSTLKAKKAEQQQPQLTASSRNALSDFSGILGGDTMKGTVQLLGTKRVPPTTADEVDLSFDVDIPDDLEKRFDPALRPRASFESHLSIEDDDEDLPPSLPSAPPRGAIKSKSGPSSPRKPRDSASSLASQAESLHEDIEEGFELPTDMRGLSLSSERARARGSSRGQGPRQQQHCRFTSSDSLSSASSRNGGGGDFFSDEQENKHEHDDDDDDDPRTRTLSSASGTSARSGDISSTSALLRPSSHHSRTARSRPSMTTLFSPSSGSPSGASADEGGGDNDADFFDGIEAGPMFQPEATTSASSPSTSLGGHKVDLQALLKAKLAARLQANEAQEPQTPPSPPHSATSSRRRHPHRDKNDSFEDGLIVDEQAFKRISSRGGSLDSTAFSKHVASRSHQSLSGRPGSASAVLPSAGSAATIGRRGLTHTKSFVRALSEAHADGKAAAATSISQSTVSHQTAQPTRQIIGRKLSTPLLSVKPASSGSASTAHQTDASRQRTASLNRKSSMPLLNPEQQGSQANVVRSGRSNAAAEGRDARLSPTGVPPTRPSTPAGSGAAVRLTMPTLSSIAKQRLKPTSLRLAHDDDAHPPRSASDPTGSTSSILFPSRGDARKPSGVSGAAASGTTTSSTILRKPKRSQHYGDGTELDAFDDLPANKEKERRFKAIAKGRPDSGTTASQQSSRKWVSNRRRTTQKAPPPVAADKGKGKGKSTRAQPQLIRNLNPTHASRVEGGMVWNPQTMKWEGNESALRAFEHVLSSSARPALISPFPAHSPGLSKGRSSKGLTAGLGGVRVVGEMVFDPVKMSWFNLDDQGEDELDFGDDEADMPADTFSTSRDAVQLNAKASFHSSQGARDLSATSSVGEGEFNEACHAAEERHQQEYKPSPASPQDRDDRSYLWKLRQIIMKSSSL